MKKVFALFSIHYDNISGEGAQMVLVDLFENKETAKAEMIKKFAECKKDYIESYAKIYSIDLTDFKEVLKVGDEEEQLEYSYTGQNTLYALEGFELFIQEREVK